MFRRALQLRETARRELYLNAFKRAGSAFRLWWLMLLGVMAKVASPIVGRSTVGTRRSQSPHSTMTPCLAILGVEQLEVRSLLTVGLPIYPPTGGVAFSSAGSVIDGGVTHTFDLSANQYAFALAEQDVLYYGLDSIRVGLAGPSNRVNFESSHLTVAAGVATWERPDIPFSDNLANTVTSYVRGRLQLSFSDVSSQSVILTGAQLPPGYAPYAGGHMSGALLKVREADKDFAATFKFEIFNGTTWQTAKSYYDGNSLGSGGLQTSIFGGFWQEMDPVIKAGTASEDNLTVSFDTSDITVLNGSTSAYQFPAANLTSVSVSGDGGADNINLNLAGASSGLVVNVTGGAGNDQIIGSNSLSERAKFSGSLSDYSVSLASGVVTVIDNRSGSPDGTDTLTDIDSLVFADKTISIPEDFVVAPAPIPVVVSSTFDRTPTFQWSAVAGATSYNIVITQNGIPVIPQQTVTANSFTPAADLAIGSYGWKVQAVGNNGYVSNFTATQNLFVGGRPTVTGPIGTAGSTPTFTWLAVQGVGTYQIRVKKINPTTLAVITPNVINKSGLTGTSYTATTPLAAGTYRFWIKAFSANPAEGSYWSLQTTFTVAANDTAPSVNSGVEESLVAKFTSQLAVTVVIARQQHQPAEVVASESDMIVVQARDEFRMTVPMPAKPATQTPMTEESHDPADKMIMDASLIDLALSNAINDGLLDQVFGGSDSV